MNEHPRYVLMRLLILFIALLPVGAEAAVYKWVQPDGTIIYSDRPPDARSAPATLPEVQEIPMPAQAPPSSEPVPATPDSPEQSVGYKSIEITAPSNDQNLFENTGQVQVHVTLDPPLRIEAKHRVALTLDGKRIVEASSDNFTLQAVDRGSHVLQATVEDEGGKVLLTTDPITFHLHRISTIKH